MKLSKKGAAIQRAIHDALASGNRRRASRYGGQVALGGLLRPTHQKFLLPADAR